MVCLSHVGSEDKYSDSKQFFTSLLYTPEDVKLTFNDIINIPTKCVIFNHSIHDFCCCFVFKNTKSKEPSALVMLRSLVTAVCLWHSVKKGPVGKRCIGCCGSRAGGTDILRGYDLVLCPSAFVWVHAAAHTAELCL